MINSEASPSGMQGRKGPLAVVKGQNPARVVAIVWNGLVYKTTVLRPYL